MTAPKTAAALALGAIRVLASQTWSGLPKTPSTMLHDLDTIRTIADGALQPPAPVPTPTPVPVPPIPPVPVPVPVPPRTGATPSQPPTPVNPPTPPQSGLPRLSGLAILGDDFSAYASTATLQAKIRASRMDGHDHALAAIDPTVTYDGHATVRYDQPGGTANTPQLWPSLPRGAVALLNVWLRAVIRFSPGFTTTGTLTASANAYKLLGLGWSNAYGRATVEITNTSGYVINATTQDSRMPAKWTPAGVVVDEWTDGAWYDYVLHYEVTSPTTVRLRLWRGRAGNPPTLAATLVLPTTPGGAPPAGSALLGLNFNQVRAAGQSQSLWYGMWEAVDGAKNANPFGLVGG